MKQNGKGLAALFADKPANGGPVAVNYGGKAVLEDLGLEGRSSLAQKLASKPGTLSAIGFQAQVLEPAKGRRKALCREGCRRVANANGVCTVCQDRANMAEFVANQHEAAQIAEANGDLDGARDAIEVIPQAARPFVITDRERCQDMLREIMALMPLSWILTELEEGQESQAKELRDAKLRRAK